MIKLYKTIRYGENKHEDVLWEDECYGAWGVPINSGIVEWCSSIEEGKCYDIYLTDYFIMSRTKGDEPDVEAMRDSSYRDIVNWEENVKKYIGDKDFWFYSLMYKGVLVGYAIQREMTESERGIKIICDYDMVANDKYIKEKINEYYASDESVRQSIEYALQHLCIKYKDDIENHYGYEIVGEILNNKRGEWEHELSSLAIQSGMLDDTDLIYVLMYGRGFFDNDDCVRGEKEIEELRNRVLQEITLGVYTWHYVDETYTEQREKLWKKAREMAYEFVSIYKNTRFESDGDLYTTIDAYLSIRDNEFEKIINKR